MKPPPRPFRRCQTCWNLEPCCTCSSLADEIAAARVNIARAADAAGVPVTEAELEAAGHEVVAGAEQLLRDARHE